MLVQQYHLRGDKRLIVFSYYLVHILLLVLFEIGLRLSLLLFFLFWVVAYTLERLQSIEFLDLGIVLSIH